MAKIYFTYYKRTKLSKNDIQTPWFSWSNEVRDSWDTVMYDSEFLHINYKYLGYVEYTSTPKKTVMKWINELQDYRVEIVWASDAIAFLDQLYSKVWNEYIISEADIEAGIEEKRHTVDNTFDWVTITLPITAYDMFEAMMTKVNNLFWGVERNVVWTNIVLSKIESDNPMLSVFMQEEVQPWVTLYQAIVWATGTIENFTI